MGAILDTNVVIDALADRKPWAKEAQDLLFLASCGKADLFLTGSTITDIYYLVNKYVCHDKRKSLEVVRRLLLSLGVANVGLEECLMAAHSNMSDFEDAVVAEAARTSGQSYIVTRSEDDYVGSSVPAISPAAYLQEIFEGRG